MGYIDPASNLAICQPNYLRRGFLRFQQWSGAYIEQLDSLHLITYDPNFSEWFWENLTPDGVDPEDLWGSAIIPKNVLEPSDPTGPFFSEEDLYAFSSGNDYKLSEYISHKVDLFDPDGLYPDVTDRYRDFYSRFFPWICNGMFLLRACECFNISFCLDNRGRQVS